MLKAEDSELGKHISEVFHSVLAPDGWQWSSTSNSDDLLWRRPVPRCEEISEFILLSNLSPVESEVVLSWRVGLRGAIVGEFERFFSSRVSFAESIIDERGFEGFEGFIYLISLQWLLLGDTTTVDVRVTDVIEQGEGETPRLNMAIFHALYRRSLQHFSRFSSIPEAIKLLSVPDILKSTSPARGVTCAEPTISASLLYLSCGRRKEAVELLESAIEGQFLPSVSNDIRFGLERAEHVKTRAIVCLQFVREKCFVESE